MEAEQVNTPVDPDGEVQLPIQQAYLNDMNRDFIIIRSQKDYLSDK